MKKKTVIQHIASAIVARRNCIKSKNEEWRDKWEEVLLTIEREHLPSGSGFDSGTRIDMIGSNEGRIVLRTSFHHMNESGCYDGWTHHVVWVYPSFDGIRIRITGRDRNGWKDYAYDVFHHALTREIDDPRD